MLNNNFKISQLWYRRSIYYISYLLNNKNYILIKLGYGIYLSKQNNVVNFYMRF